MDTHEDNVVYEFVASDKTVIKLRRMSDRQRTRFANFTMAAVQKSLNDFLRTVIEDKVIDGKTTQVMTGATVEEVRPKYDNFRHQLFAVVDELLVDPADLEILNGWDHPGDYADLTELGTLIINTEFASQDSTAVPPPEKVDEMSDKEIERLGESSARKSHRGSTSRSSTAAATSSSGAESTPDEKPVI